VEGLDPVYVSNQQALLDGQSWGGWNYAGYPYLGSCVGRSISIGVEMDVEEAVPIGVGEAPSP